MITPTPCRADVLPAAFAYAARGWAVFPCAPKGKQPLTSHGYKDATIDPGEVEAFWADACDANVAIATGSASGLLVLDIDPRNGGNASLAQLERDHGPLPATYVVHTSNGGQHIYFQIPDDVSFPCGELSDGIDIKCDGGYVIAPPSVHPSGHVYCVDASGKVPVEAPAWLIAILREKSGAQAHHQPDFHIDVRTLRISHELQQRIRDGVPEGQRSNNVFGAIRAMVKAGKTDKEIEGVMMNPAHGLAAKPIEKGRAWLQAELLRARSKADCGEITSSRALNVSSSVPKIESAATLMMRVLLEPRWVVEGLVPEGLTLFAGKSKAGKSWWALQTAVQVALEQGDVLYLALEDTERRMQDRIAAQCSSSSHNEIPERLGLVYQSNWPRLDAGGLTHLRSWLAARPGARLIIIDTLAKVKPVAKRNGNAYEEDYAALAGLKQLADEFKVGILVIHHLRKMVDVDDPFNEISGTTGLVGCADTIIVLKRPRLSDSADLYVTGRDIEEGKIPIQWDKAASRWTASSTRDGNQAQQENNHAGRAAIIELLTKRGPLAMGEVIQAFSAIPVGTIKSWVFRMTEAGKLIKEDGKYRPIQNTQNSATSATNGTTATSCEAGR